MKSEPGRIVIAPSLLAADHGRFAEEVRRVVRAGAPWVHLDVMDGHFVPNISFGPGVVAAVREEKTLFLDVHLMCSHPASLLDAFINAGADSLTVHVELENGLADLLWKIRSQGMKVGLAVNPPTRIETVKPFLNQIDLLLVMTVNPGFGGQQFIGECIPKIQAAHAWREELGLAYRIEVDGGIDHQTVQECAGAGADTFVSGTTLFRSRNLPAALRKMQLSAEQAIQR